MRVEFKYTQSLPTEHPDFSFDLVFEVEADVSDEGVKLINLWAHDSRYNTPWKALTIPKGSFSEKLCNAAREAAKQWQTENF